MKFKGFALTLVSLGALSVASCSWHDEGFAYWQRVEDTSAMYMKGPKAQQTLEENIATCASEVDELVRLDALRKTTPPDKHSEYHKALDDSGDLDFYDEPTRLGDKRVDHSSYHDFESCMRSKGWERIKYVPYEADMSSRKTYNQTQYYRETGKIVDPDVLKRIEDAEKSGGGVNKSINNE